MTEISLTDEDIKLFIAFQANYATFKVLCASGVFDLKNGKAIINFNSEGELSDIELQYHTFKKFSTGV